MNSVPDDSSGVELYKQLSGLWGKAGMHARKWLSNSEEVLKGIPSEDRALEVDLERGNLPSLKTLGILWMAKEDLFTFKASAPDDDFQFTKRNFPRRLQLCLIQWVFWHHSQSDRRFFCKVCGHLDLAGMNCLICN